MGKRLTLFLIVSLMLSTCIAQEHDLEYGKKSDFTESSETLQSTSSKPKKIFKDPKLRILEEKRQKWEHNYISLGFLNSNLSQNDFPKLKSNYGVSFNIGRTYYLHKPIAGLLRFGIDVTWCDLNYTNYRIKHITYWGTNKYQYHQGEFSMHIGPSITIRPIGALNVHGYFRYAPSFSALYANDTFYGNYATFFVGGAAISYGIVGVGIEARFGNCRYKELGSDSEVKNPSFKKTKHIGWNAYITFRF